ncbi:hypothetical protein TWF696_006031 [Orbilia brochopaga]|uniref:Prokaryotic-type class I peptide chain release factors domain-containing protein n=1 Tax=Orbilia brochopaga TaxID=3140254 RepID=A0AAV9UUX8_9PEZI
MIRGKSLLRASAAPSPRCLLRAYGRPRTPCCQAHGYRPFGVTASLYKKQMPPRPKVNEDELEEKFLKGTPKKPIGGQKKLILIYGTVNKTSSAVQLRHIPAGIVVKSQETRSREQNRKIARQLLASKLEDIEKGDQSRNNVLKQVANKKKASKRKKSLRKYRKLDEAKAEAAGQLTDGSDNESEVAGELEAGEESDGEWEEEEEEGASGSAVQVAENGPVNQLQDAKADGNTPSEKPEQR